MNIIDTLSYLYDRFFPEEKLMEIVMRMYVNNRTDAEIAAYLSNHKINWDDFFDLGIKNQLIPIILECLNDKKIKDIFPPFLIQKMEHYSFSVEYVAGIQNKEFEQLLEKAAKVKLEFAVMKTYLLDNEMFGNKYRRIRHDLDLLIPVNQFHKISTFLFENGFLHFQDHRQKKGGDCLESDNFYIPQTQEKFRRDKLTVELHTTVVDPFYFNIPTLTIDEIRKISSLHYKNSRMIWYNGQNIKIFSPPDLFISTFLHAFYQHNLQLGIRYAESALLIKKFLKDSDWKYIIGFMEKIGMKVYLFWYLSILENIFSDLFPSIIRSEIEIYGKKLSVAQKIYFFFSKYKIFHETDFLNNPAKEREKEWGWAVISRQTLKLMAYK